MPFINPKDDHDTVVQKYADQILKSNPDKYAVETCLDDQPGFKIDDITPDISIYELDEKRQPAGEPVQVMEIETVKTVAEQRADSRWKPIADKVESLQLVVPKGVAKRVKRYCKKFGIKAGIQEY